MVAVKELTELKTKILTQAAAAANRGEVDVLARLTGGASECERLLREVQDLEDRYAHLASVVDPPRPRNGDRAPDLPNQTRFSHKQVGAQLRSDWVDNLARSGIRLAGHRKRYETPSSRSVAVASANELDGKPNKWFLGLPAAKTDVAVLLCASKSGKVYDIVLPVADLGRRWDILSRSGGQIKFNVRKDVGDFFLLIPGNDPHRVTDYVGNHEPLRS